MKQKIIIGSFITFIFSILLISLLSQDKQFSKTERRKLASFPTLSLESYSSKQFPTELETYLLDQFPFRESFRTIKAVSDLALFRHLETNDIYFNENHAFKKETPFDIKQINYAIKKFNDIYEKYLNGMNVYYGIIPEKNYFDQQSLIPKRDYLQFKTLFKDNLTGFKEIDFTSMLSLDNYYYSDPHWKQETIYPIANEIIKQMGNDNIMTSFEELNFKTLEPFYGAYYGQAALPMVHDKIILVSNEAIAKASVKSIEFEGTKPVYNEELFNGMDSYDVFLSGPQALLEIELSNVDSNKELIIFRDSFGSSIASYFIGPYKKVTLIDLRYIKADMLGEYIHFKNQDVLFLYSTSVLNNGRLLK